MNYQERTTTYQAEVTPQRPLRARRVSAITAVVVIAVLAALWGFNAFRSHMMKEFFAHNAPPPVSVSTEVVQTHAMPETLTAIGSLTAVHQVTIAPEVAGRVTKFAFLPGATVKKGTLLVQINDAPEQADLASGRAQQKLAKVTLDRQRELIKRGFASQSAVDQSQSQYDAVTASIARDDAVIAQKQIRAPFDGMLGLRQVEVGQYVNTGAALVTLTDISFLYVNFTLPEQARSQLNVGQTVNVSVDAYPGRTFSAKISVLDPQIAPDTRTIKLQAIIDNKERLLMPGMFANVLVDLPPQEGVLTIQETALDHTIYGDSVFLVREAKAGADGKPRTQADGKPALEVTRVSVTAGQRLDGRVAVTGLKAGDRVVTAGQVKLFEGSLITMSTESTLVNPSQIPLH